MSSFGTFGLFICFVIGGIIAIFQVGWPAVFGLCALFYGYCWLMSAANSTFYPDGSLRPKHRRRGRGRRRGRHW